MELNELKKIKTASLYGKFNNEIKKVYRKMIVSPNELIPAYDCFKNDRKYIIFKGDDGKLHLDEVAEINYKEEVNR